MPFAIADTVIVAAIGVVSAFLQAVTLWLLNRTHRAVNSTAKVLADQKLADEKIALDREEEIGRLRGIVETQNTTARTR